MTEASPSLRLVEQANLRKVRRLAEDGHLLVDIGDRVNAEDVIARARRVGRPVAVNAASELQLKEMGELGRHLLKKIGETVQKGEVIAQKKGALGRGGKACLSPIDGVLAAGPTPSGEVIINPHPREVQLLALVPGKVAGVLPSRGAVIETTGAYLHAVTGVGTDTFGAIKILTGSPTEEIAQQTIDGDCAGCVLVGGTAGGSAIRAAAAAGARAVVVGSVSGPTFYRLLQETQPITVFVTEGFGLPGMSPTVFDLLRDRAGQLAALFVPPRSRWRRSPAEIIIPDAGSGPTSAPPRELGIGSTVRIVRGDSFGQVATVVGIPPGIRTLPSGAAATLVELATNSGERQLAARANVELIL